jgi:hypothetical protein
VLGGASIRDQELGGPWWASIYTSTQGARFGALFGVFGYGGNPFLARFYFKDVDGALADEFFVWSARTPAASLPSLGSAGLLLLGASLLASGLALVRRAALHPRCTGSRPGG